MEQIKEQQSSILNAVSIGNVLKAYRTMMERTQDEMALDISQYLQDKGLSTGNISQGTIAKLEKGSLIADLNILRYINDRILGYDIDVIKKEVFSLMEVFPLIDKIISITEVEQDEILELLQLKDKSELNRFIKKHIRKEIEPDEAKVNNFVYENIIVEKLEYFSNSIIIEEPDYDPEKITIKMNSTATLVLYLAFNYIQSYYSTQTILSIFPKLIGKIDESTEKEIIENIDKLETLKKEDFIEIVESELLEDDDPESYEFYSKLFWGKGASRIAKSKRITNLMVCVRLLCFMILNKRKVPNWENILKNDLNKEIDYEFQRKIHPYISQFYKDPLLLMKEIYNDVHSNRKPHEESDIVCRLYERIKQELETKILNNNTENIELFIKYIEFIYNDKNISCVDKKNQLSVIAQYLNIPYNTLDELAIGSEK